MIKFRRARASKINGLGDVIALVAQPIAKAIDAIAGTNIQNCSGCGSRQETFNEMFPFSRQDPPR